MLASRTHVLYIPIFPRTLSVWPPLLPLPAGPISEHPAQARGSTLILSYRHRMEAQSCTALYVLSRSC